MLDDRLREFAIAYTSAWCSQDPERVAAHFAPDGSLTINRGTPAVGRAAIAESARGFMTAFPDMVVTMDDLVEEGDRVLYHWTLAGTNSGPGGGGRRVRISGREDWRLGADGLIAESLGTFDAAEYARQLEHGAPATAPAAGRGDRSPGVAVQLIPVVLSLLVLAAHFLRSGNLLMVLVLLGIIALLGVRRPWAAYTAQAALAIGVIEWIRTLLVLAAERAKSGEPGERMVLILGSVAFITGLSTLVFGTSRMRARYGIGAR